MRNQVSTLFNGIGNYITGFAKQFGTNWRENNKEMNGGSEDLRKTMDLWDMIVNSHNAGVQKVEEYSRPLLSNPKTQNSTKKTTKNQNNK